MPRPSPQPLTLALTFFALLAPLPSAQAFITPQLHKTDALRADERRPDRHSKTRWVSPDGVVIEEVRKGSGKILNDPTNIKVHYVGWLTDGTEFDSSRKRGRPTTFPWGKGRLIKGWDKGLKGMQVGDIWKLTIPPEMGYGERGAPGAIPPNATLIFEVELIEIK